MGGDIKISLQKSEVLQEGVKLCRAEAAEEGLRSPGNTIPVKNCHRLLILWITWQVELWPRFSEGTN